MPRKKTNEEFLKEVYEQVGNEYTFLDLYKDMNTKITVRHNCERCKSHEWMVTPHNFLNNHTRCPKCNHRTRIIVTEEYKQKIYNLVGDEYTVLNEYVDCKTKISIRHNCIKCNNYEWMVNPSYFYQHIKCPKCSKHDFTKKELILKIQEKGKELKRTPSASNMKNPSSGVYYKVFDSWYNALKESGFITTK